MKEAELGITVRRLREAAGLSLRALAEETGFSASFLSQVENGQASPSIASMERIAVALGVTLGQFFDITGSTAEPVEIVKAGEGLTLKSGWSKAEMELLRSDGRDYRIEPVLLSIAPGGTSGSRPYASTREEFALVLEGSVVLTLDPGSRGTGQRHTLQTGDAVTISAGTGRRWENAGKLPARILMVAAR